MKTLIRKIVGWLVHLTSKYACDTYGEVAELADGPCKRCVGCEVRGTTSDDYVVYHEELVLANPSQAER